MYDTKQYDRTILHAVKSWRVAILVYHMEPTQKINKKMN